MNDKDIKDLALIVTANCVRNTVIEDYHAEGKLSDAEMKEFNKEVSNKLYTFFKYMFAGKGEEYVNLIQAMNLLYPSGWDAPILDEEFVAAAKKVGLGGLGVKS